MTHVTGDVGQCRGILVGPDMLTSFLHQRSPPSSAKRLAAETEQSVPRHRVACVSCLRVGRRAVQKCVQCQLIALLCALRALHMQDRGRVCKDVWEYPARCRTN